MPKVGQKVGAAPAKNGKPAPVAEVEVEEVAAVPATPRDEPAGKDTSAVVYPEFKVKECWGDAPLTASQATELVGWQPEDEEAGLVFGEDYDLVDRNGVKIRLTNNGRNRIYYDDLGNAWAQEVLAGRWAGPNGTGDRTPNGQTLEVDEYGNVASGAHRCAGLILAAQDVANHPEKYPHWAGKEPVMDCLVVTGVCSNDRVINTIDTGKARTDADVIYRSELFADEPSQSARFAKSRALAAAVAELRKRTGGARGAFSAVKTRGATQAIIQHHPSLRQAVLDCYAANAGGGGLKKLGVGVGTAAAVMYLMAAGGTEDPEAYRASRDEADLDLSRWEQASSYWTLLAGEKKKTPQVAGVRSAAAELTDKDLGAGGHWQERVAVAIKGWGVFLEAGEVTDPGPCRLEYEESKGEYVRDDDGWLVVEVWPTVGGVDLGKDGGDGGQAPADDPADAEELEDRKAAAKAPGPAGLKAEVEVWRNKHVGRTLMFYNHGLKAYSLFGKDAVGAGKVLGLVKKVQHMPDGLERLMITVPEFTAAVAKLLAAGMKPTTVEKLAGGGTTVQDYPLDADGPGVVRGGEVAAKAGKAKPAIKADTTTAKPVQKKNHTKPAAKAAPAEKPAKAKAKK